MGHLLEMLEASGVGAELEAGRVPLLPGAADYCAMGLRTVTGAEARDFYACKLDVAAAVDEVLLDLLHDAQTSGGLLVALAEPEALVERLRAAGVGEAVAIGRIVPEPPGRLAIR